MSHIPLFFQFGQIVAGRGFVADVRFLGRATCTREFGSTWIYGVNPGALAEEGESLQDAYDNFRDALVSILFALAEDAADFGAFRAAARSFFDATDGTSVDEWRTAREAIRAGETPDLDDAALQRITEDPDPEFTVVEVRPAEATPELNRSALDQPHLLAA